MANDGAAESTSPAEAMSRSMCAGATCPRMVGPTAVLDDDSTWSLNSRRWSAVSSRARATSSSSESAARSPRPARAASASALFSIISGHSSADMTQPMVVAIRSAASGLWSSGWGT